MRVALLLITLLTAGFADARYDRDQQLTVATLNGIDIAYTTAGEAEGPPVLLIMGLGGSHRLWGEDFVNGIVDAGYRVVLFDNRDTGQSEFLDELGEPVLWWELLKNTIGFGVNAAYSLDDMAADAAAVLDELDIESAHIVGASMGGMIAQVFAHQYPERTRTLVSIMSTTGAPHLPPPSDEAGDGLQNIAGESEDEALARMHDIGMHPEAMPRQLMAILAAGDRSADVAAIGAPTLVLHGADDALLPPEHGQHTAELIEGSEIVIYEGMAHNMPEDVVPQLTADMVAHMGAH